MLSFKFSEPCIAGFVVLIGFVLLAIACCLSWNNFQQKSTWVLLCCCLVALFGPAVVDLLFDSSEQSVLQDSYRSPYARIAEPGSEGDFAKVQSLLSFLVLGVAVAFFVLIAGGRFLTKWIFRCFQKIDIKVPRTKGLICVAFVLFVLAMANNILIANGINLFRESTGYRSLERTAVFVVALVVFPAVMIGLSWCLASSCRIWVILLASFLVVFAPVLVSGHPEFQYVAPREILLAIGGVFGFTFLMTVFSIRKTWNYSEASSEGNTKSRGALRRPSLWFGFVFCVVAFFAMAPRYLDYEAFAVPTGFNRRKISVEERFKSAWESAKVNRQTNGAIRRINQSFVFECKPNTSPTF